MEMPAQLRPAFWGALTGAAVVTLTGFTWGGWVTGTAAEQLATRRAGKAVVTALAPICVENFNRGKDATGQLVELKKVRTWERADFITKGGWAVVPGPSAVDNSLASACADMIVGKS